MKTITICGSMKFTEQMKEIALKLEIDCGYNVLQCVYNEKNEPINAMKLNTLSKAHYKKIDLSDSIYVVDINGYIGSSVTEEIMYAKKNAKEVIFHSQQNLFNKSK